MTSIVSILDENRNDRWSFIRDVVHRLDAQSNKMLVLDDLRRCFADEVVNAFTDAMFARGYLHGEDGFWHWVDPKRSTGFIDKPNLTLVQVVEREIVPF